MNYLSKIEITQHNRTDFPYRLPLFCKETTIELKTPITFIVGENGAGKSTFLESLAGVIGFNQMGGNANHNYGTTEQYDIEEILKLQWNIKTKKGFFFRAESFYNFSNYIDNLMDEDCGIRFAYGGKKLVEQSYGESFLSLFKTKFRDGLFILDEPEAALSPERQLSLISILNDLTKYHNAQFIIATHSPILITAPNSTIYEIDDCNWIEKKYDETKQFELYKSFINNPNRYLYYLTKE